MQACLNKNVLYNVRKAGIHPDNREEEMALLADVHELLDRMVEDGFNPKRWNALACTIPAGQEGDRWRAKNVELAENSEGLLPQVRANELEIVTARGSHGTSALRCAKLGARTMHKHLAGSDLKLSQEFICDLQPTFRDPLENGVMYDVIPGESAVAVPKLMSTLARNGNNFNDVFRLHIFIAGVLSHPRAQSTIKKSDRWDEKALRACKDNGSKTFLPKARMLADVVKNWAGGKDADLVKQLEEYEKGFDFKCMLSPAHLQALSKVELKYPRYIIALVKAMLTSPTADQGGYSNTFTVPGFASVSHGGKNQAAAETGVEFVQQADQFLDVYSRMTPAHRSKVVSKLETRVVMYVHSKKHPQ